MVTIVIPCYNQAKYIQHTLDSVKSQTYRDWECIIVNDGSTDDSASVVQNYIQQDVRIRLVEQDNQGLSAARNTGIRNANGKYIQFLDADDILLPDKLAKQVQELEQSKADVCVCHHSVFTDTLANVWDNEFSNAIYNLTPKGFLYNWGRTFVIAIHSGLFRTEFLQSNNLYFDEHVRALEDWLFWTSLAYHQATFSEIPDKLALYRVHELSMTKDKSHMQRNHVLAFIRMYDFLPEPDKAEFLQQGTDNLIQFFANSNRDKEIERKANSVDYKFGAAILKPLHMLSSFLKHL